MLPAFQDLTPVAHHPPRCDGLFHVQACKVDACTLGLDTDQKTLAVFPRVGVRIVFCVLDKDMEDRLGNIIKIPTIEGPWNIGGVDHQGQPRLAKLQPLLPVSYKNYKWDHPTPEQARDLATDILWAQTWARIRRRPGTGTSVLEYFVSKEKYEKTVNMGLHRRQCALLAPGLSAPGDMLPESWTTKHRPAPVPGSPLDKPLSEILAQAGFLDPYETHRLSLEAKGIEKPGLPSAPAVTIYAPIDHPDYV